MKSPICWRIESPTDLLSQSSISPSPLTINQRRAEWHLFGIPANQNQRLGQLRPVIADQIGNPTAMKQLIIVASSVQWIRYTYTVFRLNWIWLAFGKLSPKLLGFPIHPSDLKPNQTAKVWAPSIKILILIHPCPISFFQYHHSPTQTQWTQNQPDFAPTHQSWIDTKV